jgi:ferredoxin-NADP reductase
MDQMNEAGGAGVTPIEKAVHDLERAEDHLARAHADEAEADREVRDALQELKEVEHQEHHVTVHVVHVNEAEKASFEEPVTRTLQQVWDEAYVKMTITRNPNDVFQTGGHNPVSLMVHLGLSLKQAKDQGVITDYKFGIASATGGA